MANFNYQAVANTVADNITNRQDAAAAGNFLSTALQVYQKHLLDTQADQINAAQNAPKATAVTDASGNPVFGDGTSASNPPTLDQEQATNAAYATTDPTATGNWDTTPTVPGAGGVAGLMLRMKQQQTNLASALAQNRIQNLQGQIASRNAPDPLGDAIKKTQLAIKQKQLDGLNNPNGPTPTPGQQGVQNRFDTKQAYIQRQAALSGQANWFKQNAGIAPEVWGNWSNPRMVDDQGNQSNNGTYFMADVPDGKGGTIPLKIPVSTYQQGQQNLLNYNALKTAPITPPAASPTASVAASASTGTGSSIDDRAIAWAYANPGDQANQILQRNGLQ